ncbi:DUF488 domain-containing protein [Entomohabitans teleogrylli]|uniref:DUF488 domain-containing protein n=1 Tax=Entomohabitans teleogrylli TaxID=1384589 RepID=UPI00073D8858|nr:DUF488 domain-containing protein [Entomohabitans teleogrylli]
MIQCKRVYEPVGADDGYRILVDRLWPRGIKKADLVCDEWCKAIAPSTDLRKIFHSGVVDFAHFNQQYRQELKDNPEVHRLAEIARTRTLTLLYGARNTTQNHAEVLADVLRSYPL